MRKSTKPFPAGRCFHYLTGEERAAANKAAREARGESTVIGNRQPATARLEVSP